MNERDDHLRYEDDLAAYLLDALSSEEAGRFERHLESCPRCRERARWLGGSVELLPTAIEQVEPPPELRERLMRTVQAEADHERSRAPREGRSPAGYRRGRLARLLSVPRPALALAAAAVIAVAAIGGYALGTGGDDSATVTADAPPGVTATVELDGDRGILRVSGLEQRTDGIYEVWLERDGKVEPSTLFQVHRDGTGAAAIPRGLEGADQVMVTLEARGGSPKPTRAPLIVAKV